jgi:hypothetical protein
MKQKQVSRSARRMTLADLDEKIYGPEPDPMGKEISEKDRKLFLVRSLSWYSQSFDRKKSEEFVLSWIKNSYNMSKKELSTFNFVQFHPTFYGLMKLESNGFDLTKAERDSIKNHIDLLVSSGTKTENKNPNILEKNPQLLLKEKVNKTILADLEGMLDQWLFGHSLSERKEEYDFDEKIRTYEIKGAVAINLIKDFLSAKINELSCSLKKDEGYEVKPGNVNRALGFLRQFYSSLDLIKIENKNRTQRSRRTSKVSTSSNVEKILSTVKYQKEAKEFKISSLSPDKILGKTLLYVFDTKYRTLRVLHTNSPNGFGIKGTTVQNIDEEKSSSIRLRKPLEVLPSVLTKTKLQIEKILENLSTKPTNATGRLNENVVILRSL